MLELFREFWGFAKEHGKFLVFGIILMFLGLGAILYFAATHAAVAPFIYTLF